MRKENGYAAMITRSGHWDKRLIEDPEADPHRETESMTGVTP